MKASADDEIEIYDTSLFNYKVLKYSETVAEIDAVSKSLEASRWTLICIYDRVCPRRETRSSLFYLIIVSFEALIF